MKYRDSINIKIEVLENDLKILRMIVQRAEPIKRYIDHLEATEEHLAEVKNLIALESLSASEVAR